MARGSRSALRALARMSLRRSRSDVGALAAALLTAVVAVAAVSVGPVYTSAVARSGLQSELDSATGTAAGVRVVASRRAADWPGADRAVSSVLGAVREPAGGEVVRAGRSAAYDLPAATAAAVGRAAGAAGDVITVAGFLDGLAEHAVLAQGRWPAGPVEAVLPAGSVLRVPVGATVELRDRSTGAPLRLTVVGSYEPRDETAAFWFGDRLVTGGIAPGSFTTAGPFLMERAGFLAAHRDTRVSLEWRVTPPPAAVGLDAVGPLRAAIAALPGRLAAATEGSAPTVESELPRLLDESSEALTRARSGVLLPVVQLGVLAAVALLLIAGLLAHRRARDTRLLVARGVAPLHVLALAATDAAGLVLPAVLLGPLLAVAAVSVLDDVGPLAATGLELAPAVTPATWALAAGTAAACILALAVPSWLHARRLTAPERRIRTRSRRALPGLAQRANADLALLAVAAVGLWQLRRYGGTVVSDGSGGAEVDPLLVAGPALGLVAGGVLMLRVVPLVARAAERMAAARRGLAGALGGWQLARATTGWSRPALLLTLATATAAFGAAYGTTWADAQRDRAGFSSGADLRVEPRGALAALPTSAQAAAYADLPGVEAVLPVRRLSGYGPATTDSATVLALDSRRAAEVLALRPDLADRPVAELMSLLSEDDPDAAAPAVTLPVGATRVAVEAALLPADARPRSPVLSLVLRDGAGFLLRLPGRSLAADGAVHRVEWDLRTPLPSGTAVAPAGPLSIVAVELATTTGTIWVGSAPVASEGGIDRFTVRALLAGTAGQVAAVSARAEWAGAISSASAGTVAPQLEVVPAGSAVVAATIERGPGFRGDAVTATLTPGRASPPVRALPALATRRFLERTGSAVGDTVRVKVGEVDGVRVVGRLAELPTTGDTGLGGLVVDLAALDERGFGLAGSVSPTGELWLATRGDGDATRRALADPPYDSVRITARSDLTDDLLRDPIGAGLVGALVLSVVAALVFAVLGYAAAAATAVRDRAAESTLLRALGAPPSAVARGVATEHLVVATIGLGAGLALGIALARLVLPQSMPTAAGIAALPEVRVVIPWLTLGVLAAAVGAALALVVAALVRRTGRGPATGPAPEAEVAW